MPRLSAVLFTALPLLMMMVAQQQQASAGTNHFLGFGNYGIHAIARTEYDVVPTCVVAEHAHEEEMSYTFDPDNWPIFVMDDDEPSGATYDIDDAMEEVMRATAGVCLEEGAWVAGWNVTAVRLFGPLTRKPMRKVNTGPKGIHERTCLDSRGSWELKMGLEGLEARSGVPNFRSMELLLDRNFSSRSTGWLGLQLSVVS